MGKFENFDLLIEKYSKEYERILSKSGFYPSLGSIGFQERNLTVNFSKAYEQMFPTALAWFEFQFKVEKNHKHVDCLIFDKESQRIILIEAKRLNSNRKLKGIKEDIERINNFAREDQINLSGNKRLRIEDLSLHRNQYHFFGLILADIWKEGTQQPLIIDNCSASDGDFIFPFEIASRFLGGQYNLIYHLWEIKQ